MLLVPLCCGLSLAQAQVPIQVPRQDPRHNFGCSVPLAACTQRRVEHLLRQSSELAAAAALKPAGKLSEKDQRTVEAFDRWLRMQSSKARTLAQFGQKATAADMQMSFNLQYLELQSPMQNDMMKEKHDTAKNSIGNIR